MKNSTNCKNLFEFDKEMVICHHSEALAEESNKRDILASPQHDIIVIGTDEAGRGPGAGGVFASAVYFPNPNSELIKKLSCLNDSKKLSKKVREELYDIILENTINSTVCIEVEEIEKINILNASLKAMKLACTNVVLNFSSSCFRVKREIQGRVQDRTSERPCDPARPTDGGNGNSGRRANILILVDGNKLIKGISPSTLRPLGEKVSEGRMRGNIEQKYIVKGDSKSASIAAASILAKVTRDRYMQELDAKFPMYNWKQNAGYLTPEHLEKIEQYGITPHHRKSFLRGRNTKQLSLY